MPTTSRSLKFQSRVVELVVVLEWGLEVVDVEERDAEGGRVMGMEEEDDSEGMEIDCEMLDVGCEEDGDSSIGSISGCRAIPIVGNVVDTRTGEEMTDCRFGSGGGFCFLGDILRTIPPSDDSVSVCVVVEGMGVDLEEGRLGSWGGLRAGPSSMSIKSSSPSCGAFVAILAPLSVRNGLFSTSNSDVSRSIYAVGLQ